jgi:hypothetical protein
MSYAYAPPLTLSAPVLKRAAEIADRVSRLRASLSDEDLLRLRRIGRVRSIQSTLAIEGNMLTHGQVAAILEGKHVLASPREVEEVRNALLAYGGGCQGSCRFNPFAQNLIGLAAQTHIRGLATLAAWTVGSVKRGCRAVGRSLRTPPSLPSPRTGSRSFVLAALRFAAGAPP